MVGKSVPRTSSGADRDRTGDLCSAIAALSQLSYSPVPLKERPRTELAGPVPTKLNLGAGERYVKLTLVAGIW
jgi:hypothetical protein